MSLQINNFLVVVLFLTASNAAPKQGAGTVFNIPEECKGQKYCSVKPQGYDELEEMMNKALPEFLITNYADRTDEINWDDFNDTRDNCPYYTKKEPMYHYYHGENGTEVDIIVQTKFFTQLVETVTCRYETPYIDVKAETQCLSGIGLTDFNMRSSCEELHAKRVLYVYDPKRTKIDPKYVDVPAGCYCKVSFK